MVPLSIRGHLLLGFVGVAAILIVAWLITANRLSVVGGNDTATVMTTDALTKNVFARMKLNDDEETGLRGYLLTGKPEFLQPYHAARQQLPALRQLGDVLASQEPGALPLQKTMRQRAVAWESWAQALLRRPLPATPRSPAVIREQMQGKALNDRLRTASTDLLRLLDARRQGHLQTSIGTLDTLRTWLLGIVVAALGLLAFAGRHTIRAVTRPLVQLEQRARAIGRGDLGNPIDVRGPVELFRLAEAMERMRRQLRSQHELATSIGSTLQLDDVYAAFASYIRDMAPYERLTLSIGTVVDGEPAISTVYSTGPAIAGEEIGQSPLSAHSVARTVYVTQTPIIRDNLSDVRPEESLGDEQAALDAGLRSDAIVPLLSDGRAIGAVHLWSRQPAVYSQQVLEPIQAFAPFVAAALENARLYEKVQQAAQALRESKDLYETVLSSLEEGVILQYADGRIGAANHSAARILGTTVDQLLGQSGYDLQWTIANADGPSLSGDLHPAREALRTGKPSTNILMEFQTADRGQAWLTVNAQPLLHDDGPYAVVCSFTDITVSRAVVGALRESEERFRNAVDYAPIGMALVSLDGRLLQVNQAFSTALGYTEQELLTFTFTELTHSDDLENHLPSMRRAVAGEIHSYQIDKRYIHKDGHTVWIRVSVSLLRNAAGDPLHYVAQFEDISQRKQAEAALVASEHAYRELSAELEVRVEARTAQLEMAVRELEAFSYSVSHDLRAPLRAVHGFSRILLEEHKQALAPEAGRYLELVSQEAQKMGVLIDDLLRFSRLSRQPLTTQPLFMANLVQEVLDDLRFDIEGRKVEVEIGDLPRCQADPALLKQVLVNLLSNALKFTQLRETAHITVGYKEQNDEHVYFVKDNGVGFDMKYAPKLFGVFQRLHRVEDYAGTGVGLAIVQRIVHRHGGRIWADAAPDEGATFYFTLGSSSGNA
ncbi:MAG: multi-sensor signal transduction multi-kinase [Chloroflexi bacterium]|nr:multi-sensor signal transduction multi-kinase [Chloroflexota bacterium]